MILRISLRETIEKKEKLKFWMNTIVEIKQKLIIQNS